jgi:hypothetical protein
MFSRRAPGARAAAGGCAMRSSRSALASALCFAVFLATSPDARPDVLLPGERPTLHEVCVDLGPFGASSTWQYVVRKGDTLGGIAQRELGSARRHAEIGRLNPTASPKSLRVGSSLRMPPRAATSADGARAGWWEFFCWTPGDRAAPPARVYSGAAISGLKPGARLYAAPHDLVASKGRALDGATLDKDPRVARSGEIEVLRTVRDDDPAARIVTRYEVVSIEGRTLGLRVVDETRFDGSGNPIVPEADSGSPLLVGLGVLLGALALGGAVLLAARRLRAAETSDTGPP